MYYCVRNNILFGTYYAGSTDTRNSVTKLLTAEPWRESWCMCGLENIAYALPERVSSTYEKLRGSVTFAPALFSVRVGEITKWPSTSPASDA